MAFHILHEVGSNANTFSDLRLIRTNIEMVMSLEGFDLMRRVVPTVISCMEKLPLMNNGRHFPLFNFVEEKRFYGSIGEELVYPLFIPCERDIDIAWILRNDIAVENIHETIHYGLEKRIYLIETVHNRPGYSYLRVIKEGSMFAIPNSLHPSTKEMNGYQYFSGSALKEMMKVLAETCELPYYISALFRDLIGDINVGELDQQGPATSFQFKAQIQAFGMCLFSVTKCDMLYIIHCPKWPSFAYQWVKRRSQSGWPSEELKQERAAEGIFLAPAGCKEHRYEEIQWRCSFNEAERRLVRSFNSTQAKCYVLLKRIISKYVKPYFKGDVITTYHLKTLMFWTIEQTDLQYWIPENLTECIFHVLNRLAWCIPEENLFLEKDTLTKKEEVLDRIKCIIGAGWPVLTTVCTMAMDFINNQQFWMETYELIQEIINRVGCHLTYQITETMVLNSYLAKADIDKIHEADTIYSKFSEIINNLIQSACACHDAGSKEMLKNVIAKVCSIYGTHCLSLSLRPTLEISDSSRTEEFAGEIYMDISCWRNQVDCLAKHANYTYMHGHIQSTLSTAYDLLQSYFHFPVSAMSTDVPINVQLHHFFSQCYNEIMQDIVADDAICPCISDRIVSFITCREVVFTKNEIYAVPGNAKVEMFMVGNRGAPFDRFTSSFRQHLVVDPYFYVTFLAFQVFFDMEHQEGANTILQAMEIICSMPPNSHKTSSLNLLGDCYLKMGQIDKAIEKFILSLQRKNWSNAAPWHIARLVWRKLLDRWSEKFDRDV